MGEYKEMIAILKKELWSIFGNYVAYVVAIIFLITSALFLWFFNYTFNVFEIGLATMQPFFRLTPWLLMLLIPALTMKTISEEKQLGTLQWLFSKPISLSSILAGKFIAIVVLLIFILLPTLFYAYIVQVLSPDYQSIDWGMVCSGYIGLVLIGSAFISIGICTSSLTSNQIIAYVSGVFACMMAFFGLESLASFDLFGSADYYIKSLGMYFHFNSFTKGIIDSRDVVYFAFVILAFLYIGKLFIQQTKQKGS